jgi:hypothetical protein
MMRGSIPRSGLLLLCVAGGRMQASAATPKGVDGRVVIADAPTRRQRIGRTAEGVTP